MAELVCTDFLNPDKWQFDPQFIQVDSDRHTGYVCVFVSANQTEYAAVGVLKDIDGASKLAFHDVTRFQGGADAQAMMYSTVDRLRARLAAHLDETGLPNLILRRGELSPDSRLECWDTLTKLSAGDERPHFAVN